MRKSSILVVILGIAVLYLLSGPAPREIADEVFRERFAPEAEARAKLKADSILEEQTTSVAPPWAGSYYHGDGLGVNVSLSLGARAGFNFTWTGCLGLYDRNFGSVELQDHLLRLICEFPNSRRGFKGIATELIHVVWDERSYLIEANDVMDFVNDVNAGDEPRSGLDGRYFMRIGDEDLPTSGRPLIPPEWSALLLDEPLKAKALSVEFTPNNDPDDNFPENGYVVLDIGEEHGVREGLRFFALGVDACGGGRVTELGPTQCTVHIRNLDPGDPLPKAGQLFGTRRP